ncbi:glycoside hydrolase family 113 [Phaeodactylibacter xiamenensis]|uniref:glycoside hydrolase family 113 n=1 Tax=Phaeodactylibacter xiamenensis TaxID=1524460 RepID=UPI003BAAE71C
MKRLSALAYCSLIIALCLHCSDHKQMAAKASVANLPHLDTLRQHLWQSRAITVVYPASMDSTLKSLSTALHPFKVRMISAEQAQPENLKGSLFLIGTPENNPWICNTPLRPAIHFQPPSILLNSQIIPEDAVAFLSFYPNPHAPYFPLFLATANDERQLREALARRMREGFSAFGWGGWQYEVYQGPYRIRCGKYHPTDWTLLAERQFQAASTVVAPPSAACFEYHWHGDSTNRSDFRSFVMACDQQAAAVLAFCDTIWHEASIPVHGFPDMEAKGLALNNTSPLQFSIQANRIDAIANSVYSTSWLGPQNQFLLRRILGAPRFPLLEAGLALTFNPSWQKHGLSYWKDRLAHTGLLPGLADLEAFWADEYQSPFLRQLAAAAFCDFLLRHWGKAAFLENYANWAPDAAALLSMEPQWQSYLSENAIMPEPREAGTAPYLKGFNFAHEGYAIYNGYGSKLAAGMLQEQFSLGANAVAIVPYSYMRSPNAPQPLSIMNRAGTENDESVIRDLVYARRLGLQTVLKPQIWMGGGHWPGDVRMDNKADWEAFFRHYTRWIVHYALMAELYNADVFCVGVEFAQATLIEPDAWREVIRTVRAVYSGRLTYAANWGPEFEELAFWDELDLIGLNCYYPLSEAKQPSEAELSERFEQVLQKARAVSNTFGRPLILTEIGFTSTATPWQQPHLDGEGEAYLGSAQLRCYHIVTQALARSTDWCRGVLWWKYPSYPTLGGEGHTGFTPNDKPTEEQLPELFGRLPE